MLQLGCQPRKESSRRVRGGLRHRRFPATQELHGKHRVSQGRHLLQLGQREGWARYRRMRPGVHRKQGALGMSKRQGLLRKADVLQLGCQPRKERSRRVRGGLRPRRLPATQEMQSRRRLHGESADVLQLGWGTRRPFRRGLWAGVLREL